MIKIFTEVIIFRIQLLIVDKGDKTDGEGIDLAWRHGVFFQASRGCFMHVKLNCKFYWIMYGQSSCSCLYKCTRLLHMEGCQSLEGVVDRQPWLHFVEMMTPLTWTGTTTLAAHGTCYHAMSWNMPYFIEHKFGYRGRLQQEIEI